MKYVLLLTDHDVGDGPEPNDSATATLMSEYRSLERALTAEGVFCGGQALHPPSMTTGLRIRAGRVILHDGPFVDTTDSVIGYYLIECRDLDHAVDVAARVPASRTGTVEIRPVWEYESMIGD